MAQQQEIDRLAGRIHRAYLRRGADWSDGCSTSRVWTAAAAALYQCHHEDPAYPIDPELFVAAQAFTAGTADPWIDLASPQAAERYRRRVMQIVAQLRKELGREIRRGEVQVDQQGRSLEEVVGGRDSRISPLARFIIAHRASRPDLADRWMQDALAQHQSCPLYRSAALSFTSAELYPQESMARRMGNPSKYCPAMSLN